MRGQSLLAAQIIAVAGFLAGCAGTPPEVQDRTMAVAAPAPSAGPVASSVASSTSGQDRRLENADRKRVVRNGQEYYCQRQAVTGSRTKVIESCMTKDQLLLVLDSAQEFHGNVTGGAGNATAGQDANGATQMGAMPMSVVR